MRRGDGCGKPRFDPHPFGSTISAGAAGKSARATFFIAAHAPPEHIDTNVEAARWKRALRDLRCDLVDVEYAAAPGAATGVL